MAYGSTLEDFEDAHNRFRRSKIAKKYPNFVTYIETSYLSRKEQIVLAFRPKAAHGATTNNLCEVSLLFASFFSSLSPF